MHIRGVQLVSRAAEIRHIIATSQHILARASFTLVPSRLYSMSSVVKYPLAKRLEKFGGQTVWQEFTPLAKETGAVNLGQGFPDWPSPDFVKAAMTRAVTENHNQYARSAGHPPLVQALAKRYSKIFGRELNWETEVTIGVGSSECLFAIMQSFVDEDDEVVLISPAFDIYSAQVTMAGGKCVYVPLRLKPSPTDATQQVWTLDFDELRRAFTDKTKVLLINTPQNPTGKMFDSAELHQIASIVKDFPRVVVVSDEVYEQMTYGKPHERFANIPDMWERTLTVSSAGKTFSITGWKVGWVLGPAELVKGVVTTNQWVQFSVSTPAQQAIAYCLEEADGPYKGYPTYYDWLRAEYSRKRDILLTALRSAGLNPIAPEGSFFIIADTSNIAVPEKYMSETTEASGPIMRRDWAFCRFLTKEVGVACIPPSAFYDERDKDLARNIARFAFCKEDASLYDAALRLQKAREYLIDKSVVLPAPPTKPSA